MCIIVAKKKGIAMPSVETLKNCFENNSDGAGFAYLNNGQVHYQKGFMKVDDLLKALDKLTIDKKNCDMVFHFRIGTSGTNSKGLTHPFKICDNYKEMKQTKGNGNVLFHNGVLYDFSPKHDDNKEDINDTMNFTRTIINNLPRNWVEDEITKYMVGKTIGTSKLAILTNKGLTLIGNYVEDNGIMYSNDTYKKQTYYPIYSSYYGYDTTSKTTKWWDKYNWNDYDYNNDYDYGYGLNQKSTTKTEKKETKKDLTYYYEDDWKFLYGKMIKSIRQTTSGTIVDTTDNKSWLKYWDGNRHDWLYALI